MPNQQNVHAVPVGALYGLPGFTERFEQYENLNNILTTLSAAAGALAAWEETPESALALVIVLDQFPRNMFRGQRRCYDCDAMARAVTQRTLARGFDRKIAHAERKFFYLPFMHSEYLPDQEHCLELARSYGEEEFARDAEQHAEIIRRFGRFPHRNAIMGRSTTAQEQAFLDAGGFAG